MNISDIDVEQFERMIEASKKFAAKVGEALKPIVEKMQALCNTLEPYQKFELMHPRKKPRGSLRRIKRLKREQRYDK